VVIATLSLVDLLLASLLFRLILQYLTLLALRKRRLIEGRIALCLLVELYALFFSASVYPSASSIELYA
jgi:hypothetical protein